MLLLPHNVTRPGRYLGIEPNRIMKNAESRVRFCLCYPDVYEIGMSYFGFFLLYELANSVEGVWCERCFAPWLDMEDHLRSRGAPLSTLESRTPLGLMDVVGFSLTYELNVTNVLNMLSLASIPLRAEEREKGPLVIGGGPLMLNPAPFEAFFDLVVVGEAEEALPQVLGLVKALKGEPRQRLIEEASRVEGVYSPLLPRKPVKRLYIEDLNRSPHPIRPPIPLVGSVHNRLSVEISRGCGNGCRFCVAGYGYRPYRERDPLALAEIIDRATAETGFEEISLLSLSSGDYTCLSFLMGHIRKRFPSISVSLPSLRVGSITEEEIELLAGGARGGLTFALETSTMELRDRLNKDIEIELLTDRLPLLKRHGWRKVKLYLMVGFPWEREEDLLAVRRLIAPFIRHGMEVNLAVSPFTPKAHTPFQWLPMEEESTLREKTALVKKAAAGRGVKIKARDSKVAMTEALISRGDGRLAPLFEALHKQGTRLEAWTECFNGGLYEEWLSGQNGLGPALLGPREPGASLPWDFIDTGVDKAFLLKELGKAEQKEKTPDCYRACAGCGLSCAGPRTGAEEKAVSLSAPSAPVAAGRGSDESAAAPDLSDQTPGRPAFAALTVRYAKYGEARYLGHLDTVDLLLRALRSAGIVLKMHGKYHPKPRISLSPALPVGIESVCETMEIEADGLSKIDAAMIDAINCRLPQGMRVMASPPEGAAFAPAPAAPSHGAPSHGAPGAAGTSPADGCAYLLVGRKGLSGEALPEASPLKEVGEKGFYQWHGARVKDLWLSGDFQRIFKVEKRRIDGLRADHQHHLR